VTVGGILGFLFVVAALLAVAWRTRDWSWAAMAGITSIGPILATWRSGLDPMLFANADQAILFVGAVLLAAGVALGLGIPRAIEEQLYLGDRLPTWTFEQEIIRARQPYLDAARAGDDSVDDKVRWRRLLTAPTPSAAWTALADGLARVDQDWVDRRRSADVEAWQSWRERADEMNAEWARLREPAVARRRFRGRLVGRVATVGMLGSAVCLVIGFLGIPSTLAGPPAGRAAVVPVHPAGRHLYLAPIGAFPPAELDELAAFYSVRYDLDVQVLAPAALIPPNPERSQINADGLGTLLQLTFPEAGDPDNRIIGVLAEDIYLPSRPDWAWAFGASGEQISVISTYRMQSRNGPFAATLERTRLRKMVTRYIGFSYFGLPRSEDPHSVLYDNVLGVPDLDRMGEDY
jgi:hypothetical protein